MKKRIGLIGYGRWGSNILRDLNLLNAEVHVAELIKNKRELAMTNGASSVCINHLLLPEVDGYIVVSETANHYEIITGLFKKGKPIFSEKPLTNSLTDTEQLVEIADNNIFVMHKWRYHPGIQKLAEIVKSEEHGRILHLDIERKQFGIPHIDVDASFILTPHDLSIALHILGVIPELITAYGNSDSAGNIHYLNMQLGSSPSCKIEISDRYAINSRVVHVQAEKASLILKDALAESILIQPKEGEAFSIPIDTEFPLLKELRAFLDYLNGGKQPMSSLTEELQIMSCLNSARNLILNRV